MGFLESADVKKMRYDLSDASDQINMNLLKILLYPDSIDVEMWKDIIYLSLNHLYRIKRTRKWPESRKIEEWLSTHNDMIEQYVILAKDEECELAPRYVSIDMIKESIEDYYKWIAKELSANGVVRKADVYAKIDMILLITL